MSNILQLPRWFFHPIKMLKEIENILNITMADFNSIINTFIKLFLEDVQKVTE